MVNGHVLPHMASLGGNMPWLDSCSKWRAMWNLMVEPTSNLAPLVFIGC